MTFLPNEIPEPNQEECRNMTNDAATTWRDLADQLTPEDIAQLEKFEEGPAWQSDHQQLLLNFAVSAAKHNSAQKRYAHIAAPPDAVAEIDDWEEWRELERDHDPGWGRMFASSKRELSSGAAVEVGGVQFSDGCVERSIRAWVEDDGMTAAQTRELAAALIDAADELERLS